MALKERVKSAYVPTHGLPCSVGNALLNLPAEERDALAKLLGTRERHGAVASHVFALMQAEREDLLAQAAEADDPAEEARLIDLAGVYDVKYQQINKHRGGNCRCTKAAA